jgi:signal transduction histidine kinase
MNPFHSIANVYAAAGEIGTAPLHSELLFSAALVLILTMGAVLAAVMLRKSLWGRRGTQEDSAALRPSNESAFVTASMQGVIEKLRAKQKELERLHLLAQERTQQVERLNEEVFRNMPTGLMLVNAAGIIGITNPALEDALGMRSLRYRSYKEVLSGESDLAVMICECLISGAFQHGKVEHLTRAGDVRRLNVTISPIEQSAKAAMQNAKSGNAVRERSDATNERKPSGVICLICDMTELTALQDQIRSNESLVAMGEMAAAMAREFKNALGTISVQAETIDDDAASDAIRNSAETILNQARAMTHAITEFLRLAKPTDIHRKPVRLQEIVASVMDEARSCASEYAAECRGEFAEVSGDEQLLRRALMNLMQNAVEALENATDPRVTIQGTIESLGGRKWQRISVTDNGPGIPEQDISKIFLPFYSTKTDGAGIGLMVVRKIALDHGGNVEACNGQGTGAEFLLWLPLGHETAPLTVGLGGRASKI